MFDMIWARWFPPEPSNYAGQVRPCSEPAGLGEVNDEELNRLDEAIKSSALGGKEYVKFAYLCEMLPEPIKKYRKMIHEFIPEVIEQGYGKEKESLHVGGFIGALLGFKTGLVDDLPRNLCRDVLELLFDPLGTVCDIIDSVMPNNPDNCVAQIMRAWQSGDDFSRGRIAGNITGQVAIIVASKKFSAKVASGRALEAASAASEVGSAAGVAEAASEAASVAKEAQSATRVAKSAEVASKVASVAKGAEAASKAASVAKEAQSAAKVAKDVETVAKSTAGAAKSAETVAKGTKAASGANTAVKEAKSTAGVAKGTETVAKGATAAGGASTAAKEAKGAAGVAKGAETVSVKTSVAAKEVEVVSETGAVAKVETAVESTNKGDSVSGKYKVGAYQDIRGMEGLDAHHVGQKAVMKRFVESYDPKTAPAINVPKVGHTISGPNGVVSRSTKGMDNARQVLARDLFELRRVYPDIPNSSCKELIDMNLKMYQEMRK